MLPLARHFEEAGHDVLLTARAYGDTFGILRARARRSSQPGRASVKVRGSSTDWRSGRGSSSASSNGNLLVRISS